jgi:putative spermidine/putrescine transport system substrate-binding protein
MKRKWMQRMALVSLSVLAATAFVHLASAGSMDDLVAAAKKEGQLTVIALPHDWCGYGEVIEGFKKKIWPDRQ